MRAGIWSAGSMTAGLKIAWEELQTSFSTPSPPSRAVYFSYSKAICP
jgi:hypothetical protein